MGACNFSAIVKLFLELSAQTLRHKERQERSGANIRGARPCTKVRGVHPNRAAGFPDPLRVLIALRALIYLLFVQRRGITDPVLIDALSIFVFTFSIFTGALGGLAPWR
jgi:hypothetical protein